MCLKGTPARRDVIAHPQGDAAAAMLASRLAVRFGPTAVTATGEPPRDAPLCVASAPHRWHRDADAPVILVTDAARDREALSGHAVLCAARDERDASVVALADVFARALELPLVIARVVPEDTVMVSVPDGVPVYFRLAERDPAAERFRVRSIVAEAGIDFTGDDMIAVLTGEVGSALASEVGKADAALLVVGPSRSRRLKRALFGSDVDELLRRCACPLVICPDDPTAGMRLRELWERRAFRSA
jgi:nucleotide-binding universal stress UspA family protein